MRRLVSVLVAVAFGLAGLTAVALRRAGEDRYAGLKEQALTLARVLRGAAEEAATTVATAEQHLERRLAAAARRADVELSRGRMPDSDIVDTVAREEHVGRIFVFDDEGRVVAMASGDPRRHGFISHGNSLPDFDRLDAIEREEAEHAIARWKPERGRTVPEGLQPNAFGTRERFGLAYGRPDGGALLLRADAQELANLRQRFGLEPVLVRAANMPGVRRVSIVDGAGRVVLDGAPDGGDRVVTLPPLAAGADVAGEAESGVRATSGFEVEGQPPLFADVVLSTARADEAVARSRSAILLGAGVAALLAMGLAGVLVLREGRHLRARALAESRREEERRLAEMGALAGLVTHELANPLNAVRLGLRVLEDAPPEAPREPILRGVQEEAARMSRTLEGFLGLARGEGRERRSVGPEILERARERVQAQAGPRHVRVRVEVTDERARVTGDPLVLEQALTNLVRNAVDASLERESVDLAWGRAEDGGVRITVTDRGSGFPASERDALLRVGGTTRPGGHGLGLPLAHRFVRMHGGRMTLEDAPGGGARVVVWLPAGGGESHA